MLDVNNFDQLRIGLATADSIRTWSNGEVKKPETINYRTLKPEKDGLFCEKIFGPTKDWECYCGKYKRVRFQGIICERCGVEVTRSKVRRERMGHIELAAPVVHIWYLRGTRSWLAYLLMGTEPREELKAKQLEKVIYFAANLVTWVDEEKRHADLPNLEAELAEELEEIEQRARPRRRPPVQGRSRTRSPSSRRTAPRTPRSRPARRRRRRSSRTSASGPTPSSSSSSAPSTSSATSTPARSSRTRCCGASSRDRYGEYFEGGMGAEAIAQLIDRIDFDAEEIKLRERHRRRRRPPSAVGPAQAEGHQAAEDRHRLQPARRARPAGQRPAGHDPRRRAGHPARPAPHGAARRWPLRHVRPQRPLPPGHQPQQPAEATARPRRARDHRQQREAHAAGGRRRPVRQRPPRPARSPGPGNRPLKSLSDMLKGKQGRFRQNLLGKRVDYSGRSVIVVGPTLKLHQCGLPKQMALELFKPFVMKRLVDTELAQNIKSAKRMVERRRAQVWDVLEEVIKEHPVFLNRAPTLHRLGIQAFEPLLVEGKAIQIHPLVCAAFNADFDGDQMAVHLPLSAEAQAEARILMLSANNILSPATGRPITVPTQDMVFGAYYLTLDDRGRRGRGPHVPPPVRGGAGLRGGRHRTCTPRSRCRDPQRSRATDDGRLRGARDHRRAGCSSTRRCRPTSAYVNDVVGKKNAPHRPTSSRSSPTPTRRRSWPRASTRSRTSASASPAQSGLTISIDDVQDAAREGGDPRPYEKEAEKIETQFKRGIITDDERRQKEIEIWTSATSEVGRAMERTLGEHDVQPDRHDGGLRRPRQPAAGRARSPACRAWWPTRGARSSPGRSSPTSVRACRCSSTSSPPTAPARVWPTPPCAPPTPATSPAGSSTWPRS